MATSVYGPNNKSIYTQILELFAKIALHSPTQPTYYLRSENGQSQLYAKLEHLQINLTEALAKADLKHVYLSHQDSLTFDEKVQSFNTHNSYYSDGDRYHYNRIHLNPKYQNLTFAEFKAIYNYTGGDNRQINNLLYGKNAWIEECQQESGFFEDVVHKMFLNVCFLASGLNTISPELNFTSQTFRGENRTSIKEILYRISLINSDEPTSQQPAFMSTSDDRDMAEIFAAGCFINFKTAYGKDIASLSQFESESEYLILPGHIQWDSVEYKNGTFYFNAQIVNQNHLTTVTQEEIK